MAELEGCIKPARGLIASAPESIAPANAGPVTEEYMTLARVGGEAPDFEANAFIAGEGFKPVKLSDYRRDWIVLCFYPGDFTFV